MSKNKNKINRRFRKNGDNVLRLNVFKSNVNIVAQLIDDSKAHTLYSESSITIKDKTRSEKAIIVAQSLAKKLKKNTYKIYFDNSEQYKGSVKLFVDEFRNSGFIN